VPVLFVVLVVLLVVAALLVRKSKPEVNELTFLSNPLIVVSTLTEDGKHGNKEVIFLFINFLHVFSNIFNSLKGKKIAITGSNGFVSHHLINYLKTNNLDNKYLHTTSLVKYSVFDKGKNYSGTNLLKKKILLDFIEKNFLEELKTLKKSIIVPLGNTVSSTIEYLNSKYNLKLECFLKGFPHPSGANARKNIQFKEHKLNMISLLK
jgi:hypothetical protein